MRDTLLMLVVASTVWGGAQEIGYVERFSLADDREAALRELVPNTEDYFYYHALHAQNIGDTERFNKTMEEWQQWRNGNVVPRARELLNRQALLDYEKKPWESLSYLARELGLHFNHTRAADMVNRKLPTALDQKIVAAKTLMQSALRESGRSLELIEDCGLVLAVSEKLTPERRRSLLARLTLPTVPNLVEMIAADLEYKDSRGFGSLNIHGALTLEQMDELLKRKGELRQESNFVTAYLARLAPVDEVDLDVNAVARGEYLERVWEFVRLLEPAHNSLKANVFYNRLKHDAGQGVYNKERLLEYLKVPRNVVYLRPELRESIKRQDQLAELTHDFKLIALPPVVQEEPLVREYLLRLLRDARDFSEFQRYLRDDFLKPLFAEAKIVNGIGDPQEWAKLLSPEAYRQIRERVDIEFAADNAVVFKPAELAKLRAFVKNVSELTLKIYEINSFNYYCETGKPLNLALNLDGLVATSSRSLKYEEGMERRVERSFEMPELNRRGTFVVELIGNGRSSRALVQRGQINVTQKIGAAGHQFQAWDEGGNLLEGASGWFGGREFKADKQGRIIVPFSTAPASATLVVRSGEMAALVNFAHLAESYKLVAGIYVEHEALIRHERAEVAVRPVLTVHGEPVSLKLLESPRLVVRTTDINGIVSEREFRDVKLREDAETLQEIRVPEGAVKLEATLFGRVRNLSAGRDDELSSTTSIELNEINNSYDVLAGYLGRDKQGYYLELRGKNGELAVGREVTLAFKLRCFRRESRVMLQSDDMGRVALGELRDVVRVRLDGSRMRSLSWELAAEQCSWPEVLHGQVGEKLRLPVVWDTAEADKGVVLLERRGGAVVRSWPKALSMKGGFLEIGELPAGNYTLHSNGMGREVAIKVTAGKRVDNLVLGERRALEQSKLEPVHLTMEAGKDRLELKVDNVTPLTRVHLVATRYLGSGRLFKELGEVERPGLGQQRWTTARTFYESGREIGDEYRYILERQGHKRYIGNMLERPGLLLNPWVIRSTEAAEERLADGGAYVGRAAEAQSVAQVARALRAGMEEVAGAGYVSYDFLQQPPVVLMNLVPDKDGRIVVPYSELHGLPMVQAVVVDPLSAVMRSMALEQSEVATREVRQVMGFDPEKKLIEEKQVKVVQAGGSVMVKDVTSERYEVLDTVGKVYKLLAMLSDDEAFAEFAFVGRWHELDGAEQRSLYSKYACHELSFFLYHKDRKFFDAVVLPHLKNKRDKTFMDEWLLGGDLRSWLELERVRSLNMAERALLGQRVREQQPALARDLDERLAVVAFDDERFNRCFEIAMSSTALEYEGSALGGELETLRDNIKKERAQALGRVAFEEAPAPAAAPPAGLDQVELRRRGVASGMRVAKAAGGVALRERQDADAVDGKPDVADDSLVVADAEVAFSDDLSEARSEGRKFFQKLERTQELAENNYWHRRPESQGAGMIGISRFWSDYALYNGNAPFLSRGVLESAGSFAEAMLGLAVLELPFEAGEHQEELDGVEYTLKAATPLLMLQKEISSGEVGEGEMLVAQRFFRQDDRTRIEQGQEVDKLVSDEFLAGVVYGAQVVVTNPSGERRRVDILLQIPQGAVPVAGGFYTRSVYMQLEPFTTKRFEYYFYFPEVGSYQHYPVTVAERGEVAGGAKPFVFNVVKELSQIDKGSWAWISQHGSGDQVLGYLRDQNLHHIAGSLEMIAWRMKDREFFERVIAVLRARYIYNATLWSYAIDYNVKAVIEEFLAQSGFNTKCGLWLESSLLKIDPVWDGRYEHLEYAPLVNPRAHQVGANRTILNDRVREQVQRMLQVLTYKAKLGSRDALAVSYYMALQDRIEEAIKWLARVDRNQLAEQMQYDYLRGWLALCQGEVAVAREITEHYSKGSVERWHERFVQMAGYIDQVEGRDGVGTNRDKRDQVLASLASSEPSLVLHVEGGGIRLDTRNLASCRINFYPMDVELLFSRNPFMQEGDVRFSYVTPALTQDLALEAGMGSVEVELPQEFRSRNVMVEVVGAGVRQSQAYYANRLKVQLAEAYGQLYVSNADSGKPVAGAYIKVYARNSQRKVSFVKDGYTDLLGRFDYASLNSDELERAERLSILILSDELGAVVREVGVPQR